jgi:hypothetical protein
MAREDLITKNDAKYIINLAIEHIEKECCPYTTVLELLGGVKKDIDELKPAETLTPCERDGHDYEEACCIYNRSEHSKLVAKRYVCKKCGKLTRIDFLD